MPRTTSPARGAAWRTRTAEPARLVAPANLDADSPPRKAPASERWADQLVHWRPAPNRNATTAITRPARTPVRRPRDAAPARELFFLRVQVMIAADPKLTARPTSQGGSLRGVPQGQLVTPQYSFSAHMSQTAPDPAASRIASSSGIADRRIDWLSVKTMARSGPGVMVGIQSTSPRMDGWIVVRSPAECCDPRGSWEGSGEGAEGPEPGCLTGPVRRITPSEGCGLWL